MVAKDGWWGWLRALLRRLGIGREQAEARIDSIQAPSDSQTVAPAARDTPPHYALRDDFLTPAEASFYRVLCATIGERQLIFPKVRLADLMYASRQEGQYAAWQRINRKHVDFVLCDPQTVRPVLAIELDDRSHQRPDRVQRDAFVDQVFAAVKLPLVHVPARHSYNTQELAALLAETLTQPVGAIQSEPPTTVGSAETRVCERCGGTMRLRTANQGQHKEQQFWGCSNYPRCRNVVAVS
jgi:hypothetical protein